MQIFPVVHINEIGVSVEQTLIALEMGADGAYLISHSGNSSDVFGVLRQVRDQNPSAFLGVNLLGEDTVGALGSVLEHGRRSAIYPDALWSDSIRAYGGAPSAAMEFKEAHLELSSVAILGGIAFKYTADYTDDAEQAAAQAHELEPWVDIVTTSGPGTGFAAPRRKIVAMKAAVSKPLAVASGICRSNIADYAGYVDQVLVASSVETAPYSGLFDQAELGMLIALTKSLSNA